ncbi:MAG: hypothetical protein K1X53_01395 [Candidatus Sumerlaeaceae bacterium]|nr:hypothetical protein [Candidatus Sumerlaeaceae bacterium]
MKRSVNAFLTVALVVTAHLAHADVPAQQILIEARIVDARIADLSTLGVSYDVSGSNFLTTFSMTQGPGGSLSGDAFVTDMYSSQSFVVPLDGAIKALANNPLRFNLDGRLEAPRINVNIRGEGDANQLQLRSTVSRPGMAGDTVRLDVKPVVSDFGVTIQIDPNSITVDGDTASGKGTAILPGTLGAIMVYTRQTVNRDRFKVSVESGDGDFKAGFSGRGILPDVDRLGRGTVDTGTGPIIFIKPSLLLTTDSP